MDAFVLQSFSHKWFIQFIFSDADNSELAKQTRRKLKDERQRKKERKRNKKARIEKECTTERMNCFRYGIDAVAKMLLLYMTLIKDVINGQI